MKKSKNKKVLLNGAYAILGICILVIGVLYSMPSLFSIGGVIGFKGGLAVTVMSIARQGVVNRPPVDVLKNAVNVEAPGTHHVFTDPKKFKEANEYVIPDEVTLSISSTKGAGTPVTTSVYIFQNDVFGTIDDNSSGANSITYNWNDGYEGLVISWILALSRMAVGQTFYGFTAECVNNDGTRNDTALGALIPTFVNQDGLGNFIPRAKPSNINRTRGDFQTNITVFVQCVNMYKVRQHKLTLAPPVNPITSINTNLCYYTHPDFPI